MACVLDVHELPEHRRYCEGGDMMYEPNELAREYIRELLREEYDAFWAAAANAIADLIERGYLR